MQNTLKLPFQFDPHRLAADLAAITADEWVPHFNTGYYHGQWSGIALRSVGGETGRLYPDPTATQSFAYTPTLDRCPYIRAVLAAFACPLEAVRLLKLCPGSSIREHRDYKLGYEDGEVWLHIPVVTNPDVEFYLEQQRLVLSPGECWYIDFNLRHRVANNGRGDRIHLVIDCVVNDWLERLLVAASKAEAAG